MNKIGIIVLATLLFSACNESSADNTEDKKEISINETQSEVENTEPSPVEKIIDNVYLKYGAEQIESSNITFSFRDYEYAYLQQEKGVERTRKFKNDNGETVMDVWQGDSLIRLKEGEQIALSDKKEKAYKNSINSVFYFAFLPKALKDPAVNAELIDEVLIEDKRYHKIKVTFDEEEGGEDFNDIFLFWIGVDDYAMDYFAYQYFSEGGGIRFRKTSKVKEVNGIVFQDYLNYGPKEEMMDNYINVDQVFSQDGLKLVSTIELENIQVE